MNLEKIIKNNITVAEVSGEELLITDTLEKKAEKTGEKTMMTTFSVYNLARNDEFDYYKMKKEAGTASLV